MSTNTVRKIRQDKWGYKSLSYKGTSYVPMGTEPGHRDQVAAKRSQMAAGSFATVDEAGETPKGIKTLAVRSVDGGPTEIWCAHKFHGPCETEVWNELAGRNDPYKRSHWG